MTSGVQWLGQPRNSGVVGSQWPKRALDAEASRLSLWRVNLFQTEETVRKMRCLLSAEERAGADRYRQPGREQRILRRAALRSLAGRALRCAPAGVQLAYGPAGKPYIVGGGMAATSPMHFSVSVSNGVCVIAFTPTGPVGVDIELIREFPRLNEVAARYFSSDQVVAMSGLPVDERVGAFYRFWSRAEALSKAHGSDLGTGLLSAASRPCSALLLRWPAGPGAGASNVSGTVDWVTSDVRVLDGYQVGLALTSCFPPSRVDVLDFEFPATDDHFDTEGERADD